MAEETQSVCVVRSWTYGIGCNCEVCIEFNGKEFHVILSPTASPVETDEGSLLQRLDAALQSGDEEEGDAIREEIADLVCEAGLSMFELRAPPSEGSSSTIDLDSFLHPETIHLQLVTKNGPVQIIEQQEKPLEGQHLALNVVNSNLPRVSPKAIQVLQPLRRKDIVKVLVNGQERCCKIASNVTHQAVQRELDCLSKVSSTSHGSFIRVPKLVGLVQTSRDGPIIGIIEEYIYSTFGTNYPTLQGIDMHNVMHTRKDRWAGQIRKSVQSLHQSGVIWGDGKPENVLVDVNDDAWLIDFGGGWTKGWVDEHLAGTIEGDTQAVENIEKFLGVGMYAPGGGDGEGLG
ncbi:hypothetical protein B0J14DRAFT_611543 [Halenospora varia]|nr:hypothetical protein B0J14DRAFT_611543 [Halenospora varia]